MTIIFKAKTGEAYHLKVLAELLTNNLKTGCFELHKDGIALRQMDAHRRCLVDLNLQSENFSLYKYKRNSRMFVGINLNHFHKMLKSVKKKDSLDGWEVFKFQLREERRLDKEFNNIEDFLKHWLTENNCTKENGKLKQLFVDKGPHKETKAPQGLEGSDEKPKPPKGRLQDFQQEASNRYKQLSHAQKALYRAVGKEYFIRTKSR